MNAESIKDVGSLQAWLKALPQDTEAEREEARRRAVAIAHRTAMRVLPFDLLNRSSEGDRTANLSQLLQALRAALVSGVSAQVRSFDVRRACLRASKRNATVRAESAAARAGRVNLYGMGVELTQTATDAWLTTTGIFEAIDFDRTALENGFNFDSLPLWPFPHPRARAWGNHREEMLALGPEWRFWAEWYDNSFHGHLQDWDLLTKVALIDSAAWDKGTDHVNALIQKITVQHRLMGEARALKVEFAQLKNKLQSIRHRSHNNPPELVDEAVAAKTEVLLIWYSLDEAEKELRKPNPDLGSLTKIGRVIFRAISIISVYCASLGDLAVRSSVKGAAIGTTAILVASQNDRLQAFAEGLIKFVRSFGG
jgi:hypothetical protein